MQANRLIPSIILCSIATYLLTYFIHGSVHQLIAYFYDMSDTPWFFANNSDMWLQNVMENQEYSSFDQQAYFFKIGMVGFCGYAINWIILITALVKLPNAKGHLINFLYWLVLWNLTVVFSYIPHHVFDSIDLNHVFSSIGISVWMVYIIGGAGALVSIYILFYQQFMPMLDKLAINPIVHRRIYFTLSIVIVLFYSSLHYYFQSDTAEHPLSMHLKFWFVISGAIFWVKLVFLGLISYNINLKND